MAEPYLKPEELALWVKDKSILDLNKDIVIEMPKVVSDCLRVEAKKVGRDLDKMISDDPELLTVTKSVVADVIVRYLATSQTQEPMTQFSQAAGGYSVSGSFLIPGGGLFIKKTELARLGLRRQRYGVMDIYGLSD